MTGFSCGRHLVAVMMLLLVWGCQSSPGGSDVAADATAGTIPLQIVTDSGTREYRIELAITPEEQARGLMYRQEMEADAGMLFPYDPPRSASFWMRNTYIPLDMIFIAPDGSIESVASNTIPLSTTPYPSRGPVKAVLELNGGEAERIGARAGDQVIYTLPE